MHDAIVFDTETTGTDHEKDQIIEAAWIVMPTSPAELIGSVQLDSLESFCGRYCPDVEITLGAQATHHILAGDLITAPPSTSFEMPPTKYLVGHNIDFDWKMCGSPDVARICTLALSRALFPDLESHTQSAMIYYIGRLYQREDWARDVLRNAHAALDDVRNCAVLLRFLLKHLANKPDIPAITTWEELWHFSEVCRIPTVMGFGKHKGTPIERGKLDPGYVRWYRGQIDTDPYYLEAFRRAGF